MCRLLGIVASEPTEFRIVLRESSRSMAVLAREHRDGWGLAVYEEAARSGWRLEKGIACASDDERFHRLAVGSKGELLVSHVRKRTVGATSIENTHPFHCGRWVFAHNGTIKDLDFVRAHTSQARLDAIRGETDSEIFFAYVLTHLDAAGATDEPASLRSDAAIRKATLDARARSDFGAFNFLLSDGTCLYAHRFGRTMWILERGPEDLVRPSRRSKDGIVVQTPWSQRRHAIFVASEHMTDEPWQAIGEGMLLRLDRIPQPSWRLVAA